MACSIPKCHILQKCHRLNSGYVEALAAPDIFAADQVVAADHVALRLGKSRPVAFIGTAAELRLFASDQPGKFVLALLPAVGTGHGVRAGFRPFVEKITLFHHRSSESARTVTEARVYPMSCSRSKGKYCILRRVRRRGAAAVRKPKKRVFSILKAVKQNARDRVGMPPPEKVLPDPKQKAAASPKHKETLAGLLEWAGRED